MLVGTIKYGNHIMDVKALDRPDSLHMIIHTDMFPTIDLWDELENSAGSNTRNVKINASSVVSEIHNKEFIAKLGCTIRYAKQSCYTNFRRIRTFGSTEEFEPESAVDYDIPDLGTVTLKLGLVTKLKLNTPYFEIDMEEDNMPGEAEFNQFTGKTVSAKIDFSTLGFEPFSIVKSQPSSNIGLYTLEEIIANNPNKNFSWLLDREYVIVSDDNLEEVIAEFKNTDKPIAFDTETTGLNITFKSRTGEHDVLVGVILCKEEGKSYYFPLQHKLIDNLCGGDHAFFMENYMREILETKYIITHNGSYDWKVAHIYGINTNIMFDTLLALECTYGYKYKGYKVGLKPSAKTFLGRDSLELSDMCYGEFGDNIKFWDLPYEHVRLYGGADGDNTLALYNYMMRSSLLEEFNATKVLEIEVTFTKAVAYSEFYGHLVNVDEIPDLQHDIEMGMAKTYAKMVDIVGDDFNPNSSPQLQDILYNRLGLPKQTKREKGKEKLTTDKDAIKRLCEYEDSEGRPLYPIAHILQEYRDYNTIYKNFLKPLPTLATPDGYLFTGVKQMGTTTGRVSVTSPNYQSYNKEVKKRIIPRPGFYMTDNDYSSIEYRTLAFMSGQKELVEAFKDPDLNYHTYQAARIFNIPYEAVSDSLRKQAKGINFGLPYGMGDPSLGARVFGERTEENTRKAKKLREKYFEGQELVKEFFERERAGGVKNGYTSTYYGRRRYYDKNIFDVESIKRQAGNHVIQGTAADIYKIGVCRLFIEISKRGWLGKVLIDGFIHDETLLEVHKDIDPAELLQAVKSAFELEIEGCCPLYIGFGYGRNWYEAKSTEIPIQVQESIIERYAERGMTEIWEHDTKKLCDWVVNEIEQFSINEVKTALTNPDGQGKTLKPVITSYISDITKGYHKKYNKLKHNFIAESLADLPNLIVEEYVLKQYGKKKHIVYSDMKMSERLSLQIDYFAENYMFDELEETYNLQFDLEEFNSILQKENVANIDYIRNIKDLQEQIDVFCIMFGLDREKINIADAASIQNKEDNSQEQNNYVSDEDDYAFQQAEAIKLARIQKLGVYLDCYDNSVVFRLMKNKSFMDGISELTNKEKKGYSVMLFDCEANQMYITQAYIESDNLKQVQDMYLIYMGKQGTM